MKQRIVNWVLKHSSGDPNDPQIIPGSELRFRFGELDEGRPMFTATTYNNDGFEVWLCYTGGKWLIHLRASDARQLARFILWDWWLVSTWCGLKRKLWYWANRQNVEAAIHGQRVQF